MGLSSSSDAKNDIHLGRVSAFFSWLTARMLRTRKNPHLLKIMPDLPAALSAPLLSKGLLTRIFVMRPHSRISILSLAIVAALAGLMAPYFQKLFIDELTSIPQMTTTAGAKLAYLVLAAFVAMLLSQGLSVIVRALCSREGAIAHRLLGDVLYGHTLRLRGAARTAYTVGDTVNFYAQDVQAVVSGLEDLAPSIISSMIPLFLAPIFVSYLFDMPLGAVVTTIFAVVVILFTMSWRQSAYFTAFKRLAGERLSIVNEWLQNMRIIRILGWIPPFEQRIYAKRVEETGNRIAMVTNGSAMNSLAQVSPLLVNVVGIAALISAKSQQVTAGDVFALLWIFAVFLQRPLRMLPWTLVIFMDVFTSSRRLEAFFALPEEEDPPVGSGLSDAKSSAKDLALVVRKMHLNLGGKSILRDIDLDVKKGEFIAITGDVGSGKSQLLLSLLLESPAQFAKYELNGQNAMTLSLDALRANFAFVPQDGFVMNASIRENVLFEYLEANARPSPQVEVSLRAAQFATERDQLPNGLDTEIGERGVNLSGGQRQRVALARAMYNDRPIILLDDCFSAVDVDTERKLIDSLVRGAWKNKTRILVTHRLSILPFADRVFELDEGRLHLMQHASGLKNPVALSNAPFGEGTSKS